VGPIGIPELIFIFIMALLIFGPKKLPELGRNLGKALTEFRRASNDLRHAVEDEMREMERQTAEVKQAAKEAVSFDEIGSIDPHTDPATQPAAAASPSAEETPAHGQIKPA
jgi:sec-independent protein translocase protein TatA